MTLHTLSVPDADVSRALVAASSAPRVALVLGSGLSGLASVAERATTVPYTDFESAPRLGPVAGHAGVLVLGTISGVPVALFNGRFHTYQGASGIEASWPARMAAGLGCTTLIVTNASGGLTSHLVAGDVVLISDHINLLGVNPLVGWPGPVGGVPFVPMRDAYDSELRAHAYAAALEEGITLHDGVYAAVLGPTYETPAEAEYLRAAGADVVGMSTVPEVIVARALGLRVLGFSLVSNTAAGEGLSHAEVLEVGRQAAGELTRLMLAILRGL